MPTYTAAFIAVRYQEWSCSALLAPFFIFFFKKIIIDLQYCISFKYTAKWFCFIYIYNGIYIYTHIIFQILSIRVYYKILNISYTAGPYWSAILYIVECISTNPILLIYSSNPSPLVTVVCFLCLWVFFCFVRKFTCIIFLESTTCKRYHLIFVFVWLDFT